MFKEGDQVKHKRLCIEGVVCAVGPADNSRPYTVFSDTSGVIHAHAEDLELIPNPPQTEEFLFKVRGTHVLHDNSNKAQVFIAPAGESGELDGGIYLDMTVEEANAIHLGDEYVVTIQRKG